MDFFLGISTLLIAIVIGLFWKEIVDTIFRRKNKNEHMASQAIQGKLWRQHPDDWADIQEKIGRTDYDFAFSNVSISHATKLPNVRLSKNYIRTLCITIMRKRY